MRAAYYEDTGDARAVLRVGELVSPTPAAGEVLVRMVASGVNPSDVKSRAGFRVHAFPRVIPQGDGAGVVEDVGDGVDRSRIGERVWLWNGQWTRPFGTAAELIALPSEQAVRLPDNVSFEAGACLGVPLQTAWRALTYASPDDAETVLIAGGAGSVGHYAIQLAKRLGRRVVSTVSSDAKAEVARAAGADLVLDYHDDQMADRIRDFTGGEGVDRVVEVNLADNAVRYPDYLRRNGLVVTYGSRDWNAPLPLSRWLVHGVELAVFIVYELAPVVRRRAIAQLSDFLAEGFLDHRIAARFPLERIVAAHEAVEGGDLVGNVVVELG